MAEFKISRIRYTWRGSWSSTTQYFKDDIVKYGGSSWVCIRQHTASTFILDQTFLASETASAPSPAWIKMTDGRAWRGPWAPTTLFNAGDLINYSGNIWLCVDSHTSDPVFDEDIANWALFTSGLNYRSSWTVNTRYGQGDVVKYGGIVYRCIEGHTSNNIDNGLEADQAKWQIINEGVEFVGDWVIGQKYKVNDLVKYGGTIFRCKEGHTSGTDSTLNFDREEHWQVEFSGFEFSGDWNNSTVYQVGDVVRHGGYLFYASDVNQNDSPSNSLYQVGDKADPPSWIKLSEATNFRGDWSAAETYKTGDLVRRGGDLYVALLDTTADGSSLDYLDDSNWKIVNVAQRWRNFWAIGSTYAVNDLVSYLGSTYRCNIEHVASLENFPGDNGSGFFYWDLLIQSGSDVGMRARGDLLTYNYSRLDVGDGSTIGSTNILLGDENRLLSINNDETVIYKDYAQIQRVRYVSTDGVDDITDSQRGISPFNPWRTVRFACEQLDDGFTGTTTIRVSAGIYNEILPISIPARTAVVGAELRTTTISAAVAHPEYANDADYMIAALGRLSQVIQDVIAGNLISKTPGNTENQVILTQSSLESFDPPEFDDFGQEIFQTVSRPLETDAQVGIDVQTLIQNILQYIDFFVRSGSTNPTRTGSNTAVTASGYTNAVQVLEANKEFLAQEVVAFLNSTFAVYSFNVQERKDYAKRIIDAWKYDIIYTGNYKSLLAARYYRNLVLGSTADDMFYLRDATGLRLCTLSGLTGVLNPPNVFDLYRLPTGGSYVSLDPGWGPNDDRCWITTRSPYVQNVSTLGEGCYGQTIDGSLHNGGNKSIVSNDFTQVLSDGVGAYVKNNGRAELVSVFTYYCHVGYLTKDGGIIRGANGNCSYGRFGALADGVDLTETPITAEVYNRNQEAIVAAAFAGDFSDEIQILEWANAGRDYTQASAGFVGSGINASVLFEDFRDDAVSEARLIDTSTTITQSIGGGGYTVVGNNAQTGTDTTITIATNDPNGEADYLGMRIILTSGPGTGQYGYITAYNTITKVVSVSRESDDQPGWDNLIPEKPNASITTGTSYRIEPRVIFSAPEYSATERVTPTATTWSDIAYGETTETYSNISVSLGTGEVIQDDGLSPLQARFDVIKQGLSYSVSLNQPGAGYAVGDVLTIEGTTLGGTTPRNDLTIVVTGITDDSTDSITTFEHSGTANSGRFVAISTGGTAAVYSSDAVTWTSSALPTSGDWFSIAAGSNKFVAIRNNSNLAASSNDGISWTTRTMPASRLWNSVVYGGGKFVAVAGDQNSAAYSTDGNTWSSSTMPTAGDSSSNEWVDITYGKGMFVAVANSQNIAARSSDGITWTAQAMDVIDDSSQKDWTSIAYGNNRFVAISSTGDISWSFDAIDWYSGTMPTQDGSTAHFWKKIRYANGIFFAVGDTGSRDINGDPTSGDTNFAATSPDGVNWTPRTLATTQDWTSVGFGRPYIEVGDSSVGKATPIWVAVASGTDKFNSIRTGKRALGRPVISAGVINQIKLWDPGSGYIDAPTISFVDSNNTADARVEMRMGDGVLSEPSWINRGLGYRSTNTIVTISGDGFADVIPVGKFLTIRALPRYPGPGSQIIFAGNTTRYTIVTVESVTESVGEEGSFAARIRVSPELRNRDSLENGTTASIRERFSQIRITGHDFLDVGTGNFVETNYPELYTGLYQSAPENEVIQEDGGKVFYTSTDQSGNFRTGELFAVEQSTGIVTISADFFDLGGLTELRLGGIRIGGSGVVVREFSTDPLFTEDSNNIVPTQRAIRAYLENRLTIGGSEIAVGSFIAGTVLVGPSRINSTANLTVVVPVRADFNSGSSGIKGSILAQTMFYQSFG